MNIRQLNKTRRVRDAKDQCLYLDDVELMVDEQLDEMTNDEFNNMIFRAIESYVRRVYDEYFQQSKHYSQGKGWVYANESLGITDTPRWHVIERQATELLEKFGLTVH